MKKTVLQIEITCPITPEELQYIFDCWVTFITQDMGFLPSDALMLQIEG
jgi:hypothetical protein